MELWERIKEYFEEVYHIERYANYVDVDGYYCGDVRSMRFYYDGGVTER